MNKIKIPTEFRYLENNIVKWGAYLTADALRRQIASLTTSDLEQLQTTANEISARGHWKEIDKFVQNMTPSQSRLGGFFIQGFVAFVDELDRKNLIKGRNGSDLLVGGDKVRDIDWSTLPPHLQYLRIPCEIFEDIDFIGPELLQRIEALTSSERYQLAKAAQQIADQSHASTIQEIMASKDIDDAVIWRICILMEALEILGVV